MFRKSLSPIFDKIFGSKILVVVMLLFLFQIPYFDRVYPSIHTMYMYGSLLLTVLLIILQIMSTKVKKDLIWIFLFFGMTLYFTWKGSGSTYEYMRANFASFAMCLLFYLWMNNNPKVLIESFSYLSIYIYINLLTVILFRRGLYSDVIYHNFNWFLGYKNVHIRSILPISAMNIICSYYKYNKLNMKTKILIVCSALTFVFNGSSTSLVGYAVFLLLIFLFNKNNKKLPKLLSLRTGVIAVLVFFVLIVILRMQNLFSFIIVDVLNKDLTLHNRTIIWDRTFELIEKKLYTGYGYMSGTSYGELMNNIYFAHPHNYLLYIIFTGGISLLVVIMLGYYLADKNLRKTNRSIYSKVTLFTLLSFFLMGLTESLTGTVFIYPMLIFAMNIDKIIEQDVMDQPWRVDNILIWLKIKAVRKRISFSN